VKRTYRSPLGKTQNVMIYVLRNTQYAIRSTQHLTP
jgi:hypothetical protein